MLDLKYSPTSKGRRKCPSLEKLTEFRRKIITSCDIEQIRVQQVNLFSYLSFGVKVDNIIQKKKLFLHKSQLVGFILYVRKRSSSVCQEFRATHGLT